jgi:hypothetical protein
MTMTRKTAEKSGWQFVLDEGIFSATKPSDGGAVTQAATTEAGLLEAISYYEDLHARMDTSEPVTFDSEPATGENEQSKITDPQPTNDELRSEGRPRS